MTTTELLALWREEVGDTVADYLWSDALVYSYIDDAQKRFCRDTYGIPDARSFTLAILADGTEWYELDPQILKIRQAINTLDGSTIALVPAEKMEAERLRFDSTLGPLKALITGLEQGYLRTVPKPNLAATIELHTFRLPATVAMGDNLEIDSQHQLHLTNWIKHLAYNKQDSQTYDKNASEKFKGLHDAYCAKVKTEQDRLYRPIGSVAYGGLPITQRNRSWP